MADLFYLPFRPAIDANGLTVPGATLQFYATGSTTPLSIYADAELTTPLDNPVTANSAGVWPSIYLRSDAVYRVVLRDGDGVTMNDVDPYYPGKAGEATDDLLSASALAVASADAAALSAATAEAASGPTYASTALGLAATTSGQAFAVDAGGGLVSVYLNSSGTAVLQRTLATTGALAASGGSALVGFFQDGTGGVARTAQSKLRDTVSVKDFGAVGDGVTDDTAAIAASVTAHNSVNMKTGTYAVSEVIIPANTKVTSDGASVTIQQISGQAAGTRVVNIRTSDISFDSCKFLGNIATDTNEQNHGLYCALTSTSTASARRLNFGDYYGKDIRGDVVYLGVNATAYSAGYRLTDIRLGRIVGENILRNVVSITGGSRITVDAAIQNGAVGFMAFDIEPDPGNGPVTDVEVGHIEGAAAAVVGVNASAFSERITIRRAVLNGNNDLNSTPAYSPHSAVTGYGFQTRNVKSLAFDYFDAQNFQKQALFHVFNSGELATAFVSINHAKLLNNCINETTYNSYVNGSSGVLEMDVGRLECDTTLAVHRVFDGIANSTFRNVKSTLVSGSSLFRNCTNVSISNINQTGGLLFVNSTRVRCLGGSFNGERFFSFCTDSVAFGCDITASVSVDNSGTRNMIVASRIGGTSYFLYGTNLVLTETGDFNTAGYIRSRGTGGVGYTTGAGGSVAQSTSKATGVTLNKPTGQITMDAASLAADTAVSFTLTNSTIAAADVVNVCIKSGATAGAYMVIVDQVSAGSCRISVRNLTSGALAEALVLSFAVIKGATA